MSRNLLWSGSWRSWRAHVDECTVERGKISRWHISCCGRSVMTLYANDISCANRGKGSEPIQRRDVRAHYFTHTLILFYQKGEGRKLCDLWPKWISAGRRKRIRHKSTCDRRTDGGVTGTGPVPIAWNPHMWFMAELCVPCRGRPRPLLHEDLLLSVATTLSTALQLLFDGSSWDVSHNPSNKWSRKYFRGQGRRFFFFFLLILFCFFWWKN